MPYRCEFSVAVQHFTQSFRSSKREGISIGSGLHAVVFEGLDWTALPVAIPTHAKPLITNTQQPDTALLYRRGPSMSPLISEPLACKYGLASTPRGVQNYMRFLYRRKPCVVFFRPSTSYGDPEGGTEVMAGLIDFQNEAEVKQYLDNLGIEYSFQCHKEKDPEGLVCMLWCLRDWTGLDWTGLHWTELDWTALPVAIPTHAKPLINTQQPDTALLYRRGASMSPLISEPLACKYGLASTPRGVQNYMRFLYRRKPCVVFFRPSTSYGDPEVPRRMYVIRTEVMAGLIDFQNEAEVKQYLDNLGIEYSFQCHKEKDPEGCQRLADYLEGVKKNYEATAQVLKMNCEQNEHPESCYKLGAYYTTGKGGLPQCLKTAYSCFLKSCEKGGKKSVDACHNVGLLAHDGRALGGKVDPTLHSTPC
ncbi:UNVERIFIED_CONTAM: hypothetical protein FKN15_048421 [Acipenser sinensis]